MSDKVDLKLSPEAKLQLLAPGIVHARVALQKAATKAKSGKVEDLNALREAVGEFARRFDQFAEIAQDTTDQAKGLKPGFSLSDDEARTLVAALRTFAADDGGFLGGDREYANRLLDLAQKIEKGVL